MEYPKRAQHKIENRQANTDFYLQDMGVIFDETGGKADVPHRHDYYTVILIEQAAGEHLVDYQTYTFQPLEVYFISPGQVHQVVARTKPRGWVFTFSRDFLVENNIPESFITNINLFQPFGESPPLKIDKVTFERLLDIIRQMQECLPMELSYRSRALGALLQLFLIHCNNSSNLNPTHLDEENSGVCILRDFKHLVDARYHQWHKVNDYAAEVHLSPKYLSQTVKQYTGKSAKEFIQDRLVLEAKRLLLHTDLSVKEVAYKIGFEEPLHFSAFFKKKAGVSPSSFREH
mgnify:CR=1 FL=1